ncbi:MAG: excinuclease ABC subunit C [Rhodothermales bacterium]|nr:excinuclease ABC subunit C [Rhodothermales bacterium]MBO6779347.1 excinuclease ABC subunit C [Rhodothermales bacterium]
MDDILREKLANLPRKPGVYQHKDADGKVLYVGKAKNLRNRVNSYFKAGGQSEGRLRALVRKVADVDVIVTDTEPEALILENNLIKRFRPRYNVNLKDDKSYPYIVIKKEPFPRVFPTRRVRKDGSRYFGPYADVKGMRLMLDTIRSIFQLRTCSLNLRPEPIAAGKYSLCLQYHIKKCAGPCVGLQQEDDYDNTIRQVEQLLNGKTGSLIRLLKDEMKDQAAAMNFEIAADLRNRIRALEKYAERQKVVSLEEVDRDLFALSVDREEAIAAAAMFQVRDGKIVGSRQQYLNRIEEESDAALMQMVVERYYTEATFYPDEVFLDTPLEDPDTLASFLREQKGRNVVLHEPKRGDKAALVRMVTSNAALLLEEFRQQRVRQGEGRIPHAVRQLQDDLKLPQPPRRIECFDVSHLGGTGVVASCVVFVDGKPRKSEYRSFKVRSVGGGRSDDFASMEEVVRRRYTRRIEENGTLPDLLVIDGGKGQLSSAVSGLEDAGVYGRFPVVGLAKRLEEVFFPGDGESVFVPRASASLQLLQRARNEAHRFAVRLQRKQRKRELRTELTDVPGIGERTARKLIEQFGSVKGVRAAEEEELRDAVGPKTLEKLQAWFQANDELV